MIRQIRHHSPHAAAARCVWCDQQDKHWQFCGCRHGSAARLGAAGRPMKRHEPDPLQEAPKPNKTPTNLGLQHGTENNLE
jgi:hypothetical protein